MYKRQALNIPGTSAAVATAFDGHPLMEKGEADNALSIGLVTSFMGGLIGLVIMLAVGPAIGSFALKFGSQEYFLITMWGLTLVAVLSRGNTTKGLCSAFFGLFVGMIGMDPVMGMLRFTFGTKILKGGINFVAAMIGLFGMKEVIKQLSKTASFNISGTIYNIKGLLPKPHLLKKVWHTILLSLIHICGIGGGATPVPIPNTAVKPSSADGTRGVSPRESRSPPENLLQASPKGRP